MKLEILICNTRNTILKKQVSEIKESICNDNIRVYMIQKSDISSMKELFYQTGDEEIVSFKNSSSLSEGQIDGLFYSHRNIKQPCKYEGLLIATNANEKSKIRLLYKKMKGISKSIIFCFITVDNNRILIALLPTLNHCNDKEIRKLVFLLDTEKEIDCHNWEWVIIGYPHFSDNKLHAQEPKQTSKKDRSIMKVNHNVHVLPYFITSNNLMNTKSSGIFITDDTVHIKHPQVGVSLEIEKSKNN